MKNNMRRFVVIVVVGVALMTPMRMALADSENKAFTESESFKQLSAEWWQWALSIPTSVNPLLDTNGGKGVVGQRGSVWFLAGVFGGGAAIRTCSVPEGKAVFFPVINSLQFNSPGVCGLPRQSVSELRALAAPLIDGATALSVTVDGIAIKNLRRVKSEVFEVALPAENVFGAPCGPPSTELVPAGIYSPAVDDGIYVRLDPLDIGSHALHFHAESPKGVVQSDVTYNLTVVPVLLK
jgi:hypothetical protein